MHALVGPVRVIDPELNISVCGYAVCGCAASHGQSLDTQRLSALPVRDLDLNSFDELDPSLHVDPRICRAS